MNITLEHTDELNAVIKMQITPEDYNEGVEAQIKELKKKMNIPGFRQGNIPKGIIKKRFGDQILYEEINKVLFKSLEDYLENEKIDIFGQPIIQYNTLPTNFEFDKSYDFSFDIGLHPQFELPDKIEDTFPFYKIDIEDKKVDERIKELQKRFSETEHPEVTEENDLIKVKFTELENDGNPVSGSEEYTTTILPKTIKNKNKEAFIGLHLNDNVTINIKETFENETDLASMLAIKKEEIANKKDNFSLTVLDITRQKEAEINQDFFDKVFGKDSVKSEEEFIERVKSDIANQYEQEANLTLKQDIIQYHIDKLNFNLPDEFLKRFLHMRANTDNRPEEERKKSPQEPISKDKIEKEYPYYQNDLKWSLIRQKLAKKYEITVESKDIEEKAFEQMKNYFSMYGNNQFDDEMLKNYAKQMLENNKEEAEKLAENIVEDKLFTILKENITIAEENISWDDFLAKLKEQEAKRTANINVPENTEKEEKSE